MAAIEAAHWMKRRRESDKESLREAGVHYHARRFAMRGSSFTAGVLMASVFQPSAAPPHHLGEISVLQRRR
jgi:hypothetical protein